MALSRSRVHQARSESDGWYWFLACWVACMARHPITVRRCIATLRNILRQSTHGLAGCCCRPAHCHNSCCCRCPLHAQPSWLHWRSACRSRALVTLCRLLELALPLVVQNILGYGITLVGVISVGHLGTYELSAAILASSAMNITGFAFLVRHASPRVAAPLLARLLDFRKAKLSR